VSDVTVAPALLAAAPASAIFLGDAGYDAAALRKQAEDRGARVVIPNNPQSKHPYAFDRAAYGARNVIECLFCRLKDWRRIATRYDRLAANFASAVALAAALTC
jgi:transposase